jgi:predicted nuclease with TOPRIM domain
MSQPPLEPYEPAIGNSVIKASLENIRENIKQLKKAKSDLEQQRDFFKKEVEEWRRMYYKLRDQLEQIKK